MAELTWPQLCINQISVEGKLNDIPDICCMLSPNWFSFYFSMWNFSSSQFLRVLCLWHVCFFNALLVWNSMRQKPWHQFSLPHFFSVAELFKTKAILCLPGTLTPQDKGRLVTCQYFTTGWNSPVAQQSQYLWFYSNITETELGSSSEPSYSTNL